MADGVAGTSRSLRCAAAPQHAVSNGAAAPSWDERFLGGPYGHEISSGGGTG